MASGHARRTQAERTATTRARLLDATVGCLVDLGFSATTTTEVTKRAGVSLGALVHHFPTKAELLTAAVGHVMHERQAQFRKAMSDVEPGADLVIAAIDRLWEAFSGPAFVAWLELWVAARTDPELAAAVRELDGEFERGSIEIFEELFPASDDGEGRFRAGGLRFAMSVMDGVALRRLVIDEAEATPIDVLKTIARQRLDGDDA